MFENYLLAVHAEGDDWSDSKKHATTASLPYNGSPVNLLHPSKYGYDIYICTNCTQGTLCPAS